ncbi:MAG: ArsR/SmtB family transcription factor [Thermoanaerobaculales bacterium]
MLHALVREPGLSVGELARVIGMTPQAVSNQLRRLVDRGIVTPRRNGNNIHYRIVDACTATLLDYGLCLAVCAAEVGVAPSENIEVGATNGTETRQKD